MNALTGKQIETDPLHAGMSPEQWRGTCLNIFARNENAVIMAIEAARDAGLVNKVAHLAGQRLSALETVIRDTTLPGKLRARLDLAIGDWKMLEVRRVFLAHSVMKIAFERGGRWVLLLDVTIYRANTGTQDRWALFQEEAEDFLKKLEQANNTMSQQLGHLRSQLALAPSGQTASAVSGSAA